MKSGWRRLLSSLLIVLIGTAGGIVLAPILGWSRMWLSQKPPSRLPAPPTKAEALLGIETGGFFVAVPVVQATDRAIYTYRWSGGSPEWQPGSLPESTADLPCAPERLRRIEAEVGEITACREVEPLGEWCPAPITAYALTPEGEVWEFRKERFCTFGTVLYAMGLGIGGFVLGLVIAGVRLLILSVADRRRRRSSP